MAASCTQMKRPRRNTENALDQTVSFAADMPESPASDVDWPTSGEVRQDLSTPKPAAPRLHEHPVSIAPTIPVDEAQTSSIDVSSQWISVQPWPQSIQTSTMSVGNAIPIWTDTTAGMSLSDRKRALRAQRQRITNSFNNVPVAVPVKQEIQSSMPAQRPQNQMEPWRSSGTNHWLDTLTPSYYPPQPDHAALPRQYPSQIPPSVLSGPQEYDFQQYVTANMAQVPAPSTRIYPSQAPGEPEICLPMDFGAQADAGAANSTLMPSDNFLLSADQPMSGMNLQRPVTLQSWQNQDLPELHMQSNNVISDMFDNRPGSAWDN